MKKCIAVLLMIMFFITDTSYAYTSNFNEPSARFFLVCPYCANITRLQTDVGVNKQCANEKCKEDLSSQPILSSINEAHKLARWVKEERIKKADGLKIKSDNGIKCQYCMRNDSLDRYEILAIAEGRKNRTLTCRGCGRTYDLIDGINFYQIEKEREAKAFMAGVAIVSIAVAGAAIAANSNSRGGGYSSPSYPVYAPTIYSPPAITSYGAVTRAPAVVSSGTYLGQLSSNQYAANSVSNPYGTYGSPYSSKSINNPYGPYGSPYSSTSVTNPYTTNAPKIYASDGTYLGKLSSNPYDSESTSNPYGKYGSRYSATSINNPYSQYGSQYSSQSPNNPYSSDAPAIVGNK